MTAVEKALILVLVFSLPIMQPSVQAGRYPRVPADAVFLTAAAGFFVAAARGRLRLHLSPWFWTLAAYALALILFDGGLRTPRATFRIALWPALSLEIGRAHV